MTLEERIQRIEKQNWRLRVATLVMGACLVLAIGMGAATMQSRSTMTFEDSQGRVRIQLQVHPDFGPTISLLDIDKIERVRIGSDQQANGKPFIWFFDPGYNRVKTIEP